MQTNVKRICELLQGWSTASLHTQRKKTVGAEEYLQTFKAALESRYSSFHEDSRAIRDLIAEIHLALQVSRGDPAWRQYVAHVNSLIIQTLRASVIESLEAIIGLLDPSQRKESSAPLIEVRLELVAPDVFFNPDVNSNLAGSGLEDLVEVWVSSTLGVAKLLQRIDVGEGSYLEDVTRDELVVQLTARLRELAEQAFDKLRQFKCVYENYSGFWLQEPTQQFAAFLTEMDTELDPALQLLAFDEQINMLKQTENEIKKLHNRENIVWVSVDAKPMKQALFTLLSKWSFTYTNHLVQKVLLETEQMQAFVTSAAAKLKTFTEESDKRDAKPQMMMPDVMAVISEVKKMSSKADDMFGPWSSLINMLKGYGVQVPSWVQNHVATAPNQWHLLKMHMFQCRTLLEDFIAREQVRLKKESVEVISRANAYRAWFEKEMPFTMSDARDADFAYQAIDSQRRLKEFSEKQSDSSPTTPGTPTAGMLSRAASSNGSPFASSNSPSLALLLAELHELNAQEDMFDMPQTNHAGLNKCRLDMLMLKGVWDLVSLVNSCYQRWQELPWQGLNIDQLGEEVNFVLQTVTTGGDDAAWEGYALQEAGGRSDGMEGMEWKTWPVYIMLKDKLNTTLDSLHLMKLLQSPILRQRHWKQLTRFTGSGMLTENDMRVGEMMALNLPMHSSAVEDLVRGAEKESEIEAQLQKIEKEWTHLELQLQPDDSGHQVLLPPDMVLSVLHESMVQVQRLNFNAYVIRNATFSDQVATLQKQLGSTETLLNSWLMAQHKHNTLHALFCTQSAREQCPQIATDFDAIDAQWNAMMAQAATMPNVVETCSSDEREKQVKTLLSRLEETQTQLLSHLQSHRMEIPRLFLLSDESLLMLLSFEGNPKLAMPYVRVLFPGVHELGLEFKDNGEMQVFTSVRDRKGERISLKPIRCDGPVDEWIATMEECLRTSVATELVAALEASAANSQDALSYVLQLVFVAMGTAYTSSIHEVLDGSGSIEELIVRQEAELDEWLQVLRDRDTQEEERARVSAILINGMGWRDVATSLAAEVSYERSSSSFAWMSQIRYSVDTNKQSKVLVGNLSIPYGCSFIGHELSHIIRTGSVRALQLSLCYAVQMSAGVVIQGSIGCGKAETLKGTAHALGNLCGVCLGGESSTPQALLDSFIGYCYAGAWTELRNVSNLPLNVLSALSQAARSVLEACRMNRTHGHEGAAVSEGGAEGAMKADINGYQVSVGATFGLLSIANTAVAGSSSRGGAATWNSTLGHHASLPSSLAIVFRPIGMMPVEQGLLMTTWLLANGFRHAGKLAGALSNFMIMCQRSLSPAPQYAWTFRTSKDAIVVAASKLRLQKMSPVEDKSVASTEMQVLGSAVFDLVRPRLLPHDEYTFLTLANMFFFMDEALQSSETPAEEGDALLQTQADATSGSELDGVLCAEDSDADHTQQQPQGASGEEADMSLDSSGKEAPGTEDVRGGVSMDVAVVEVEDRHKDRKQSEQLFNTADVAQREGEEGECYGGAGEVQHVPDRNLILAARSLQLQLSHGFVARCTQLEGLLLNFSSAFVLGPPDSGKSSLIRTIAASRSRTDAVTNLRCINPKAIPHGRLFGFYDPDHCHKWVDGVVSSILREMVGADNESMSPQWMVLDAAIDPTWADFVHTLVPDDGHLVLPSQECIKKSSTFKLIFECENLLFASPGMVAYGGIVNLSGSDVGWTAFVQSWLESHYSSDPQLTPVLHKLFGPEPTDVVPQALAFLSAECGFATVVNEVVDHRQPLVEMLCSVLQGSDLLESTRLSSNHEGPGSTRSSSPSAADGDRIKCLVCTFVYALVWSLGGLLDRESKIKLNAWVRQAGDSGLLGDSSAWVPYPRSGNIFDYYFDHSDVSWKMWSDSMREFRYIWGGNEEHASEIMLVPTQQNIALQHAMLHLHKAGHAMMLHGAAGAGKSCIVRDFLASLDPEQVICASVTLNGGTTCEQLQQALEVALEHKSGRLYAPMGTKKAAFFIDDLHLPEHDGYDVQPVIEFLRHALDYGNWFDLEHCVERVIQNSSFVAAMPPSRSWVTQARFRRHCACLHVDTPTSEAMQHIYETLAVSILRTFESEVQRMAAPLAHSAVKILMDLSSVLMATAERPHYFFTQHDLSKIFKGIQAHPDLCTSAVSVAQLWLFNCHTTFMGRLVNQEDGIMCRRIIARALDMMHENLGSREGLSDLLRKAAFLCVKQQGRRLAPCLVQGNADLREHICKNLSDTFPSVGMSGNFAPGAADLEAMAALYDVQISHITMALGCAGGHVLLIGPGGGGKKTVATIAARLLGYKLVELSSLDPAAKPDVSARARADDLRTRLCNIYWEAGIAQTDIALVVHEHVLAQELVATLISETLGEGAFSQMLALFPETRRLEIYTALKNEVRKMGMVDSHENCWMLFTSHVRQHLHLIVMASTNAKLSWGRMVLSFPMLLNGMSVCWFGGHNNESMQDFASVHLSSELARVCEKGSWELILQAARHMTLVHQAAMEMASKQSGESVARSMVPPGSPHAGGKPPPPIKRQHVPLPAASLAWYCQAWSAIYKARRDLVVSRHQMAKRASGKLEAALTRLSDLETSIEDQKQMVEQKKIVANRLLSQVGQETALLDEQRALLLDDEKKQLELSENLNELQAQLKARVDLAAPALVQSAPQRYRRSSSRDRRRKAVRTRTRTCDRTAA